LSGALAVISEGDLVHGVHQREVRRNSGPPVDMAGERERGGGGLGGCMRSGREMTNEAAGPGGRVRSSSRCSLALSQGPARSGLSL
jgi:hypothetical protein